MNKLIGIALILLGIGLFGYVGPYLCLVGGIMQIVEAIKETPVSSWGIAVGVLRFLCTGFAGWLSAILPISFGLAFLSKR